MSEVLFTPCQREVGMVREGQTVAERAMARIAGPMRVGYTLYKKDGTWHQKASPSSTEVAGADPIFVGGHWYAISADVRAEIEAAGFMCENGVSQPPGILVYPAYTTFPTGA